jgi:hypothetical protein
VQLEQKQQQTSVKQQALHKAAKLKNYLTQC